MSSVAQSWIGTFRYGFSNSPVFGSFRAKPADDAPQRQLYCKALVYASCGGRLARDWIAGCAALTLSNQEMVQLALQHDATMSDMLRLREDFAKRCALSVPSPSSSASAAEPDAPPAPKYPIVQRAASASTPAASSSSSDAPVIMSPLTNEERETIERCFLYDAVKAACFHGGTLTQSQWDHLVDVASVLRLDKAFLEEVTRVVEEEANLMKEKFRVIDQQARD